MLSTESGIRWVPVPWAGKEDAVMNLRKAQGGQRRDSCSQWCSEKGAGGDSLDLVPRGHPSEPLGEWRGCTRRLWFQGEVIGTHCVPLMSSCPLNNLQFLETMWTQPMTLLLQMSDGARIGAQAFKGKKSHWLREK